VAPTRLLENGNWRVPGLLARRLDKVRLFTWRVQNWLISPKWRPDLGFDVGPRPTACALESAARTSEVAAPINDAEIGNWRSPATRVLPGLMRRLAAIRAPSRNVGNRLCEPGSKPPGGRR
jgi:hypothetical protein